MVIDWEHHISTEASFRRRNGVDGRMSWGLDEMGRGRGLVRDEIYRVDKHLEFMDTAGIDMAVISSFPGRAAELKAIVELYSRLMNDYPDRFVCLAPVDPLSSEGIDQMVWAIKDMGLNFLLIREPLKQVLSYVYLLHRLTVCRLLLILRAGK